MVADAGIVWYM